MFEAMKSKIDREREKLELENAISKKSHQITTITLHDEITHAKPVSNLMNQLSSLNSCLS